MEIISASFILRNKNYYLKVSSQIVFEIIFMLLIIYFANIK